MDASQNHLLLMRLLYNVKRYKITTSYLINPFTDKWLDLLGTVPKQALSFWSTFYILFMMQNDGRRVARRPIVLHPKLNIESRLKWQNLLDFDAASF